MRTINRLSSMKLQSLFCRENEYYQSDGVAPYMQKYFTAVASSWQRSSLKLLSRKAVTPLLVLFSCCFMAAGFASIRCFIMPLASAATVQIPFADLKVKLSSADASSRIVARRVLGENFDLYSNKALADLFSRNDNIDYTVSLLHGLIAGIDNATERKLSPGQSRDLTVHLPFISSGHIADIVTMTGNQHEEIRKQALRLVERFPVDDFKRIYDKMAAHSVKDCASLSDADRTVRWGAIFFYYNRIIQFVYQSEPFGSDARAKIDSLTSAGMKSVECLDDDRRVDAAALYFARAVVFDHTKESQTLILGELKKFNAHIEQHGGADQYYSQSHFDTIRDLQRKYTSSETGR
jgi:hypothetical protein